MNNNSKTIVSGTFKSENDLAVAVEWLDGNGIAKENVNIIIPDKAPENDMKIITSNKVSEITVKGLTTGTIIGGILGSLSFVGIIIIPAIGIAIAGPIIGSVAGITLGAITGSIIGAAIGITIPKYEAVFFDETPQKNILLVTKADKSMKNTIKHKLSSFGAVKIAIQ